jgi:primosomal protein N' (replication factor Y)
LIYYYRVFPLSKSNSELTYSSFQKIEPLQYVLIPLLDGVVRGLVIGPDTAQKKYIFKVREIIQVLHEKLPTPYWQSAIFIKNYYFQPLSATLKYFRPFIESYGEAKKIEYKPPHLSESQTVAYRSLVKNRVSLLFGDTGSGKTHIYLKAISDVVESGGDAVFLVPEVNLAPQIFSRVREVFGDSVAIWHSQVSKEMRKSSLKGIYSRDIRIVVGTLSSLFLPFRNLQLIVIDEEHSSSYAMGDFGFNGREMALYLASKLNIKAILGSATPLIGSYLKFPSVRLKGQFHNSSREVRFLNFNGISDEVLGEIENRLQKKEQTIIFVPFRGNFKSLHCSSCDEVQQCPNCSVNLTLYSGQNSVRCNRCGFEKSLPYGCSSCGSTELQSSREGTREVLKRLKILFPDSSIESIDSDKSRALVEKTLQRLRDREIDILIGTQMISKGHDYPDVTLSVILGIDRYLKTGDFQAYEKSLSLLLQISGRGGRKSDSLTVVQTEYEEFFRDYMDDYEEFLKGELAVRKGRYPPFITFIRVVIKHSRESRAEEILDHIELYYRIFAPFEIFLSGASPISKIEKRFRFQLIAKTENLTESLQFVRESIELFPKAFQKYITVEVNPNEYA